MSRLKRILLALTILLLVLIGVVAWIFRSRAEPIPEQLAEINVAEADPMKVVIPGSAGLPDLKLADLKGKTAYLVVGDRESMQAGESKLFDRALGRWQLPADVVGYAIADTEGFKLFSSKIDEILGPMRPEIRLPLYVDYEGAITKAFKLPKGHVGVVVLGPDGAVTLRHSGPPVDKDDKILKELKAADEAAAKVHVALVGTLEGLELSQWKTVAAADESRAPFEIPAAEAALVIVDSSGKLALRELGLVRMHKLSRVSELLGVDLSDRRE